LVGQGNNETAIERWPRNGQGPARLLDLLANKMAKPQEILAIPIDERFRRESFAIHTARQPVGQVNHDQPLRFGIKGDSDPDEFKPGLTFKFWGQWESGEQYGPTFAFSSFSVTAPHGKTGVVSYLKLCRHVGDAIALTLWEEFSGDAVRILRESPDQAAAAVGKRFPIEKAKEAAEDLEAMKAAENVTVELYDLFSGRGFGKRCVREAIRMWGAKAVEVLRAEPYKAKALPGIGFKKADAFYLDLGHPPDAMVRQVECLVFAATKEADEQGHVWTALENAKAGVRAAISGTTVKADDAFALAIEQNKLVSRVDGQGVTWVAEIAKAQAEQYVAEKIVDAMYAAQIGPPIGEWEERSETVMVKPDYTRCARCHRKLTAAEVWILREQPFGPDCITKVDEEAKSYQIPLTEWLSSQAREVTTTTRHLAGATRIVSAVEWPSMDRPEFAELSDHQRQQLAKALSGPIALLCGRAGSGKSYTIARLIKALVAMHGAGSILCVSPTNTASIRNRDFLRSIGCSGVATSTTYSALGVATTDGEWTFNHGELNPLPYQFIIGDEWGMVGMGHMRSFLAAIPRGCGFLMTGDPNQLVSVEYGAVLRDLIAVGLPCGELTEIHRNAGSSVAVCSAICDGRPWEFDEQLDLHTEPPKNIVLIQAGKNQAQAKLLAFLAEIRDKSPFDAVRDTQVITAVNKKSPLSRVVLNQKIQDLLNPAPPNSKTPFRINDKVVQRDKEQAPLAEQRMDRKTGQSDWKATDVKVTVYKGEFGRVILAEEKRTIVRFENPERVVLMYRASGKKKDEGDGEEKEEDEENGDKERDSGTGCNIDLGYCVTVHYMQGSQQKLIIYCADEWPGATGSHGVVDRAHVYVGFSRHTEACFVVGLKHVVNAVCQRQFIWRRKTFLREILAELAAKAGVKLNSPAVSIVSQAIVAEEDLW